ncbi:hypothetical protein B0H16DRAFT_1507696 [Mycena metata]|uniref:F-box domain-containing protein n=1 Tax=Mycena metata TaxID=1033252 RepID=A0AAD7NUF9_9AGAR|nr:hypothetical protein B0H16DRAFT_1507696 [Mycena metata]
MHRCWSIPEVLKMIFEHLPPETGLGQKALSRLARTCHQFTEPSLDSLWREQVSFTPLLRCFPAIWEESDDDDQDDFTLDINVVPEDWDRVLFYSNRIKRLLVRPHDAPTQENLQFFAMSVPADFLMPNLQHLLWSPDDDESFPFIRLFLGPNVTSLDIMMSGNISRIALLPFIGRKYPHLAHLRVLTPDDYGVDPDRLSQAFYNAIHSLSHLETLCLQYIDDQTFSHLTSLPALRSLTLADLDFTPDNSSHQSERRLFPAL